jgi:lipopolysaccharide export system permease protein
MNRLERYLGLQIVRATVMTLIALLGLLLFVTFIDELDDVGKGSYQMQDALLVALYVLPRMIYEAFPVAALIGSLLGLGGLAARGELVAMRSAGISLAGIVMAVIKTGLVMMLTVLVLGEWLGPISEAAAVELKAQKQSDQVVLNTRHGFWARDGEDFINIRRILPGAVLEDITLYRFSSERRLVRTTHAERAEYRDGQWRLMDLNEIYLDKERVNTAMVDSRDWDAVLDPGLLTLVVARPQILPMWDLWRYIRFMQANGQKATAYVGAFWSKLSTPIATLVMMVLALPFVMGNLRTAGRGQKVLLGALLGSGYFLLTRVMSYAAVAYDFSPVMSALVPAGLFLVLAVLMLRRVG